MQATVFNVLKSAAPRQPVRWLDLKSAAKELDVLPGDLWRAVRPHRRAWAKPGGTLAINITAARDYYWLAEARRRQIRYVRSGVPRTVRAGRVLVHNHVRPIGFGPRYPVGGDGFRAWTQVPEPHRLERCDCGWAPACRVHYRIIRSSSA